MIEEQLVLCIDGAIQELCKKYVVEYDIEMLRTVVHRLVESKEHLSEKTFKDILSDAVSDYRQPYEILGNLPKGAERSRV